MYSVVCTQEGRFIPLLPETATKELQKFSDDEMLLRNQYWLAREKLEAKLFTKMESLAKKASENESTSMYYEMLRINPNHSIPVNYFSAKGTLGVMVANLKFDRKAKEDILDSENKKLEILEYSLPTSEAQYLAIQGKEFTIPPNGIVISHGYKRGERIRIIPCISDYWLQHAQKSDRGYKCLGYRTNAEVNSIRPLTELKDFAYTIEAEPLYLTSLGGKSMSGGIRVKIIKIN